MISFQSTFYGIVSNFLPLLLKVHTWNWYDFHLTKDRLTQKRHQVVEFVALIFIFRFQL